MTGSIKLDHLWSHLPYPQLPCPLRWFGSSVLSSRASACSQCQHYQDKEAFVCELLTQQKINLYVCQQPLPSKEVN